MSSERREPTLGGVDNPAPILQEPVTQSNRKAIKQTEPSGSSGFIAWFAFLLAVAALAGAGFLYWQAQQYRALADATLKDADNRLAQLESRLDFTDEESTQSVESIRVKLKWADSEIRKLWGVANDRNRKSIASHKKRLDSLTKKVATAGVNAKNAVSVSSVNKKQLATALQQLQQLQASSTSAEAKLKIQQLSLQALVKDIKTQGINLDQLKDGVLERVQMNEEALESISVYRKTTNRELLNIKKRLDRVQAKPAP